MFFNLKILKSIFIIAVVVSAAIPAYAGIKPSSSAFITEHNSVPPKISAADDTNLPASYDLRDYGRIPPIRNQNPWGTCWAFGAMSSVESNYLTRLLNTDSNERAKVSKLARELAVSTDINLSPLHLAWFTKNDADRSRVLDNDADTEEKIWANSMTIFQGGFPNMSLAYFSRLDGPVLETDMPYFGFEYLNKLGYTKDEWLTLRKIAALPSYLEFSALALMRIPGSADKLPQVSDTANIAAKKFDAKLRLTDAFFGSLVTPGIYIGTRDDIENTSQALRPDPAKTKRLIMQYGAVEMGYKVNQSGDYINLETHAYYYDQPDNVGANHAVAIIGWDDNFPKENFNSGHQPSTDGAWLVRNNWDTDWPNSADKISGNPDGGYFWLSYEQPIQVALAHVVEDMPENIRVYEHDPLGYCKEAGYENNKTAWAANAFKVKSSGEKLEAISFYTTDSNAIVEWRIYTQSERPIVRRPYNDTAQLILSGSDTFEYPGYHTVKFAEQKTLTKGGYFTVVLKITNSEYFCPVAVELKFKEYANFTVVHDFESWFSEDGENWEDGAWTYFREHGTVKQTPMNACIKAFTIDSDPSDSDVEADKDLIMFKPVNDFPAVTKANISVSDRPVSKREIIAVKDRYNQFDEGEKVTFYLVNKDIAEIYVSSKDTSTPNELGLLQIDNLEYKSLFEDGYEPDEYWKTSSGNYKIYGVEYPVYGPFIENAERINGQGVFNLDVDELKYGGSTIKADGLWGAIPDGTYDVVFFDSSDVNTFKASVTLRLVGTTPKTAGMVQKSVLLYSEESVEKIKAALGMDKSDYPWPVYTGMWGGSTSLDDLTDEQKNLIPESQTAKIALPIVTVTEGHHYVFAIPRNTFNNAKLVYGNEIFLHVLPDNASDEVELSEETGDYKFFDADGNVVTRIPASGDINVAVYLEEGTYIPVISSSASEDDDGDNKKITVSRSSSGCNIGVNAALIMLAGISLMTISRRSR